MCGFGRLWPAAIAHLDVGRKSPKHEHSRYYWSRGPFPGIPRHVRLLAMAAQNDCDVAGRNRGGLCRRCRLVLKGSECSPQKGRPASAGSSHPTPGRRAGPLPSPDEWGWRPEDECTLKRNRPTTAGSGPRDSAVFAYQASGAGPLLRIVRPATLYESSDTLALRTRSGCRAEHR
jgi:hypothetical protein